MDCRIQCSLVIFIGFCVGSYTASPAPSDEADILREVEMAVVNSANYVKDKAVEEWNEIENKTVEEWDEITAKVYNSCSCINYNCGCCAHLEERDIHLNSTICVNVTYLVHDYGISFTVTLNNYTIYNETVSARNPPPICFGFPYVKEYAEVCVRLYDVDATSSHLHACVRIEARMKMILIAKYELGCFNIGPPGLNSGINLVKSEDVRMVKLEEMLSPEKTSPASSAAAVVGIVIGVITTVALIASLVIAVVVRRRQGLRHEYVWFGSTETTYLVPTA